MKRLSLVLLALFLVAAAPPPRRTIDDCERTASRAACDPRTGYIAGPSGPCRPSDLRCIEREWIRRGQVRYYPSTGLCGREHEDGGTIVACPPGVGPSAPSGGSRGAPSRSGTPARGSTRRATPPPAPPTLDEAVRTCPSLPAPRLHRNPDPEGVTGMDTWLWADGHSTLRSSGTVRGHRVTCTAVPERWTWYTGDGASYSRSHPGSAPPRHAAEHEYDRKGGYTQRLVVRWRLETSAGTTTSNRETTRSYRVVEIRGALVE